MNAYPLNPSDVEVLKELFRFCRKYSFNLSREPLPEVYSLTFDAFCTAYPEMALDDNLQDKKSPNYFGIYYVNKVAINEPTQRGKIFLFEDRIASVNDLFNIGYGDVSMFRNVLLLQCAADYVLHVSLGWKFGYSHVSTKIRLGLSLFMAHECFTCDDHYFYLQVITPLLNNEAWDLRHKQNIEAADITQPGGFYTALLNINSNALLTKINILKECFWLNENAMIDILLGHYPSAKDYFTFKSGVPGSLSSDILLADVVTMYNETSRGLGAFIKLFQGAILMRSRFHVFTPPEPDVVFNGEFAEFLMLNSH